MTCDNQMKCNVTFINTVPGTWIHPLADAQPMAASVLQGKVQYCDRDHVAYRAETLLSWPLTREPANPRYMASARLWLKTLRQLPIVSRKV